MTTYTIEVADDNEFNEGWLAYVFGLPRDPSRSNIWHLGWNTGEETRMLAPVRFVFESQLELDRPQYVVRASVTVP